MNRGSEKGKFNNFTVRCTDFWHYGQWARETFCPSKRQPVRPALLTALQEHERRRTLLHQKLTNQSALGELGRLDLRLLDRDLKTKIADLTKLLDSLDGNVALARQILRKLLAKKLQFTSTWRRAPARSSNGAQWGGCYWDWWQLKAWCP